MFIPLLFGTTSTATTLFIEFAISTFLILLLSRKLSQHADALEKTGVISAVWIGTFLLAAVTSLPEGVTTIGSALLPEALPLGVGNILGSNLFNLLIVVLLDVLHRQGPILSEADPALDATAKSGIILLTLSGGAFLAAHYMAPGALSGSLGVFFSLALVVAYIVAHRRGTEGSPTAHVTEEEVLDKPISRIVTGLIMYSALLVVTSIWLLNVCDTMAVTPMTIGSHTIVLERTVIGTILLAAATSFPELFVCIHTLKLGQVNMALGNVLGSNLVNLLFLPIMHLASRDAGFYSRLALPNTLVPIIATLLMSGLIARGLSRNSQKGVRGVGYESLWVALLYALAIAWIIQSGMVGPG